ncbi:helix-turn-helix domain-containing protein [Arthrobacter sp. 131MFCol6.1]|uniref:helix-turn-helix domain-containing protein n=1 Tax=Arthrobacter sp. 131MFCol6.1 TaxID=1157944 RepID=UPI0003674BCF|nr:helix-turn-helix domain-containing protein [Arthrobacter sp. 131MFCol6.1]
MAGQEEDSIDVLRRALREASGHVQVTLTLSRTSAENILRLLESEHGSGAVVVPVKEQYTTTEASNLLGVSRATLMKLIESGSIEAVKVGTHHRIPVDELVAFQRARQVSQERAAELLTEFSPRSTGFQSNVTFRADAPRLQRALGEGRES